MGIVIKKLAQSPYYAKQVLEDLTGSRGYGPEYVRGEMDEFLSAYNKGDIPGIEEELQDVFFGTQMLTHQRTQKDFPLYGADDKIKEFYRRKNYLQKLFDERGVDFSTDYLTGGSNVKKPHKIQGAFELAGHKLPSDVAQRYSDEYDQYKGASYHQGYFNTLEKLGLYREACQNS